MGVFGAIWERGFGGEGRCLVYRFHERHPLGWTAPRHLVPQFAVNAELRNRP